MKEKNLPNKGRVRGNSDSKKNVSTRAKVSQFKSFPSCIFDNYAIKTHQLKINVFNKTI